jgi:hypothetical protein
MVRDHHQMVPDKIIQLISSANMSEKAMLVAFVIRYFSIYIFNFFTPDFKETTCLCTKTIGLAIRGFDLQEKYVMYSVCSV